MKIYFEQLSKDLERAQTLLGNADHYLDAILLLSCHIGSYGSLRYPTLKDNESYKKVVRIYSGMQELYEQIDLLFFCQWPRSEFKGNGSYLKLKNHSEIAEVICEKYGSEEEIKGGDRYINPNIFVDLVDDCSFKDYDRDNLVQHISLFSNLELLYRYVRCQAVHSNQFPFVNSAHTAGGGIRYEDNHLINGAVLNETASNILDALKEECIQAKKMPWEL